MYKGSRHKEAQVQMVQCWVPAVTVLHSGGTAIALSRVKDDPFVLSTFVTIMETHTTILMTYS